MISFQDLLDYAQAEAIATRMSPTDASIWRGMCRKYSEMFHTPLHLVLEMDAEHVLLNVYEAQTEGMDIEDYQKLERIFDILSSIEDPNYDAKQKDEQEEFDRMAEEEEEARVAAGRAVHPSLQRDLNKQREANGEKDPDQRRTGGSINLDYLAKQDSEG